MKRTIRIVDSNTFYRKIEFGYITHSIKEHLGMVGDGEYVVTFTENSKGKYRFCSAYSHIWHIIELANVEEYRRYGRTAGSIGGFCLEAFTKIFFTPDTEKRYNITVKKVK